MRWLFVSNYENEDIDLYNEEEEDKALSKVEYKVNKARKNNKSIGHLKKKKRVNVYFASL